MCVLCSFGLERGGQGRGGSDVHKTTLCHDFCYAEKSLYSSGNVRKRNLLTLTDKSEIFCPQ